MGYTLEIIPKYLQLQVNPIYDLFVRLKPPEKKKLKLQTCKAVFSCNLDHKIDTAQLPTCDHCR